MQDSLNCNILRNELRCEVEFFSHFKWMWSGMPGCAQSLAKSQVSFITRMSEAITLFFACGQESIEVTNCLVILSECGQACSE